MTLKPAQSQLVLISVDSPYQFPLKNDYILLFFHHFFASVSLTPYRSSSLVGHLRPADHMDVLPFTISRCNCIKSSFFQTFEPS